MENVRTLTGKADKEFADSVLEVSIGANRHVLEELIEDDDVCQTLMEIMEPPQLLREKEGRNLWGIVVYMGRDCIL